MWFHTARIVMSRPMTFSQITKAAGWSLEEFIKITTSFDLDALISKSMECMFLGKRSVPLAAVRSSGIQ